MAVFPKCILRPGKEAPLRRRHPWIFSGAIMRIDKNIAEGDIVEIYSHERQYLATGFFMGGSIAVKLFSFEETDADYTFWLKKLQNAYHLRELAGLVNNPSTTAYRLIHSEGDGIPGLVIDLYNGTAVLQVHSEGISRIKHFLVEALKEIYGEKLLAVYDKSSETLRTQLKDQTLVTEDQYLFGKREDNIISEIGYKFSVDWEKGQKTGFFLDQRVNRMLAQYYSRDKKVLNAFCYSGSFSVYALKGGATHVTSVDSSKQAIEWTGENLKLNDFDESRHTGIVADVKKFLAGTDEKFDMIILDPPAFAKHHNVTHNALQAYIHINARAMERLNPGGVLMTFSCSQAISREMFQSAVTAAAIETNRDVRIINRLSQGSDHPTSIFHQEGEYLKGLVVAG